MSKRNYRQRSETVSSSESEEEEIVEEQSQKAELQSNESSDCTKNSGDGVPPAKKPKSIEKTIETVKLMQKMRANLFKSGIQTNSIDDAFRDARSSLTSSSSIGGANSDEKNAKLLKCEGLIDIKRYLKRNSSASKLGLSSSALSAGGVNSTSAAGGSTSGLAGGADELNEERIGGAFQFETNERDEDALMLKFIEEEVQKHKAAIKAAEEAQFREQDGCGGGDLYARRNASCGFGGGGAGGGRGAKHSLMKQVLEAVPEKWKPKINRANEDMTSQEMLCGIPEVDLGVEAKIKNMIAVEEAKKRMQEEMTASTSLHSAASQPQQHRRRGGGTGNISTNYAMHRRWNETDSSAITMSTFLHPGDMRATDNQHMDRFRNQQRRGHR